MMYIILNAMFLLVGASGDYVPGQPGAPWTREEVDIVRQKILAFLDPDPYAKKEMFHDFSKNEYWGQDIYGHISENALLRLSFHDCLKYTDGSGGCDGCLNWKNMGFKYTSITNRNIPEEDRKPLHYYPPADKTDNNGLDRLVYYLEKIYNSIDYPTAAPKLDVSLRESGKSRADFWQFAVNVALERTIERANYACKHDYNARQQITLLEDEGKGLEYGIWKCNIKLKRPFKFKSGRADCIPTNTSAPYVAAKEESHVTLFGTAEDVLAAVKKDFNMTAREFIALTAIHGVATRPQANEIGTKYTWFGGAYLSNMYFKMLANKPTYAFDKGGDMSFANPGTTVTVFRTSIGDKDGNPVATWGWRASCSDLWNTTDNGPCFLRPTTTFSPGNPTPKVSQWDCYGGLDENGNITVRTDHFGCKNAYFTKEGVQKGGKSHGLYSTLAWHNMFALPYEVGLYRSFQVNNVSSRAIGCKGLNVEVKDFPYTTDGGSGGNGGWGIFRHSETMDCPKNEYAPDPEEGYPNGKPIYEIVDEYAAYHDIWASDFLDAWQKMQSNGYAELEDGPENSWLGHYSLTNMNIDLGNDFTTYISEHSPLVFTSQDIDPYICGQHGGNINSCRWTFSEADKFGD